MIVLFIFYECDCIGSCMFAYELVLALGSLCNNS